MARGHFHTPVALIIFNRPTQAKAVFEQIRQARPKQLFIIADGPRSPEERALCDATRSAVANVDWDCDVKRNYAESNMGCDVRCPTGISWVFDHVDRAIILEDDCLPHPDFFPFCQELLERYKDDLRIMHITGINYQRNNPECSCTDSYFFTQIAYNHGMATWKRAWQYYDPGLSRWPYKRHYLNSKFDDPAVSAYWDYKFDRLYRGELTAWDGVWAYACLFHHGLSINPRVNLIRNIGFGPDATHTKTMLPEQGELPTSPLAIPLIHPKKVEQHEVAERYAHRVVFGINHTLFQRALSFIRFRLPPLYAGLKHGKALLGGRSS